MNEIKLQLIKNSMGKLYNNFINTVYEEHEIPEAIKNIFEQMGEETYSKLQAQIYFVELIKFKITEPKIRKELVQILEDLDKKVASFEL